MIFSKAQLLADVIGFLEYRKHAGETTLDAYLTDCGHSPGTDEHAMDLIHELHQQLAAAEFAEELADEYRELRPA